MSPEFISQAAAKLAEVYGATCVDTAVDGARTLVRVDGVEIHEACNPASTSMLIVLDPSQATPQAFVKPGQLLANGKPPKSTSTVMVGGEAWMQFSFKIPWEERHGIVRFVAAARQRFVQSE